MRRPPEPVVIVGAGPYGLAVAAQLRARRVPFRIFGEPMGSWLHSMPPGMLLKSELPASSIGSPAGAQSLEAFYERTGRDPDSPDPVSRETFCEYGLWYADSLVGEVERDRVRRIARTTETGFHVELDTGEALEAPAVVVAAGHVGFARVPDELADLPPEVFSHSSAHGDLRPLSGKRVAVVGAGQSALETAVLLAGAGGLPTLIARAGALLWNPLPPAPGRRIRTRLRQPVSALGPGWRTLFYSELPHGFRRLPAHTRVRLVAETLGPAGAWWLRERFEATVPVKLGREIEHARITNSGLRLRLRSGDAGIEELDVDHVIAGTGYRVDLERLSFLGPELTRGISRLEGSPALRRSFESSIPGLFFVGLAAAASFGPVMRFVYGSGFAGRRVAGALRALARRDV